MLVAWVGVREDPIVAVELPPSEIVSPQPFLVCRDRGEEGRDIEKESEERQHKIQNSNADTQFALCNNFC